MDFSVEGCEVFEMSKTVVPTFSGFADWRGEGGGDVMVLCEWQACTFVRTAPFVQVAGTSVHLKLCLCT